MRQISESFLVALPCLAVFLAPARSDADPRAFFAGLEQRMCKALAACHDHPDQATCQAVMFVERDSEVVQVLAAVAAGTIDFNARAAARCLATMNELPCTYIDEEPFFERLARACDGVFVGKVAPGGACLVSEECTGTAECAIEPCPDACCPGTCVAMPPEPAPAAVGRSCMDAPCVPDAYCRHDDDRQTATCTRRVPVGQPCDDIDACVAGALCEIDPKGEAGVCTVPPGLDERCEPERALLPCGRRDAYCDPVQRLCAPLPRPGQACATDEGLCVSYAECLDGRCVALPGAGKRCDLDVGLVCLGELECVDGRCMAPPPVSACPYPVRPRRPRPGSPTIYLVTSGNQ